MTENLFPNRDRVIQELVKGKEIATRLKILTQNPVLGHDPVELALQLSSSFTGILSMLGYCPKSATAQYGGSSCDSVESKKKAPVKDRRGCYKRRRTIDSWITISQSMEDGWAWRKYGQKNILNTLYPRCYFRCTNKYEGCKATKQVEKLKEDPFSYQTTYFNHHTCTDSPQLIVDSDTFEPNLLSFQSSSTSTHVNISSIKKESTTKEEKDTQSEKSSLVDPWQDIMIGSDSIGFEPLWAPIDSINFHGLDLEVNQLEDIQNFHFDEIY